MQRQNGSYDYDYDYIMAPQRGRPYGANLGSMGRNTGTWSIRSECLSNITSWSRRKGIENTIIAATVAGIMPSNNCLAWERNLGQDMVEV